jgi:hypothetical protein
MNTCFSDCASGEKVRVLSEDDEEWIIGPGSLAEMAEESLPTQHGQYLDNDDPRYLRLKLRLWTGQHGDSSLRALYRNGSTLATGDDRATVVNKVWNRMIGSR